MYMGRGGVVLFSKLMIFVWGGANKYGPFGMYQYLGGIKNRCGTGLGHLL